MQRWSVLQHVAWESPGTIAIEAYARGIPLEIHRLDLAPCVPRAEDVDALIVMGGPMGVYEIDKYTFLSSEVKLIAEMVRRGRPVLGVCLGAQLLAGALGAKVFTGPSPEIGFGSVELTGDAWRDPVFAAVPHTLPVFHWHGDTYDLPNGALLLARNANYDHQAFRFGRNAYGLQFHVELDSNTWNEWESHLPEHAVADAEQRRAQVECVGKSLIARFFDVAENFLQLQ